MRDANGNFVDMLGHIGNSDSAKRVRGELPALDPYSHGGGSPSRTSMTQPNPRTSVVMDPSDPNPLGVVTPAAIESSSAMLAEKHKIENWSEKRLVQTSPSYPSRFEALDACVGINALDECEYAYVTEDSRVVGIYRYYDVTPDQSVGKGQRRVIIPKRDQMLARQVAATAERAGVSWSTGDDLAKALERIQVAHPGAIFHARTTTSVEDGEPVKHFNLSITLKGK